MIKKIDAKKLIKAHLSTNGGSGITTLDLAWPFENITTDYWVDSKDVDNAIIAFESHKNNVLTSQSGKVYFTKTSTIPRYKLKEYLDVNQISLDRTNRVDRAQTYVANYNTIKYLKKELPTYYISNEALIVPIKELELIPNINFNKRLTTAINKYQSENVYISINDQEPVIKDIEESCPGAARKELYLIDHNWGHDKKTNIIDTINYLLAKINSTIIVFDETLLEQCTKEVSIDDSTYENIRLMLSSGDKGNVQLAIEMISNCDYVNSKHYILFLLNEFWNVSIKSSEKTVNFTNCLKYFSQYRHLITNNWQLIVDMLLKETPTDEQKQLITNYIINRINATTSYRGASFKIEEVKLNY